VIRPLRTARRRALLIASGTAVLVAVGGGTTAAFAASTGGTPSPSTTPAACAVHLRAELRGAVPGALKADLKTLHGEKTKAAKVAERKVIRQKALSGAYGERFAKVSHIVAGKTGAGTRAELPAALKADLKTLRGTAPKSAERTAERATIERKAIAGDYGTAIQTRAKAVQARVQARCEAKTAK
jgi:hypothetical protein